VLSERNAGQENTNNNTQTASNDQTTATDPNTKTEVSSREEAAPKTDQGCRDPKIREKHWLEYATVIFAGLAFITACFAAGFSWYQGWVGRDMEQRRLRAYVHPTQISATINDYNFVNVALAYKNFGSTPAFRLADYTCIAVRERKMTTTGVVDLGPTDLPESYLKKIVQPNSLIPPQNTGNKNAAAWCDKATSEKPFLSVNTPLSPDERAAIRSGASALYMYGEISYRDAFGYDRITKFRTFTNDSIAASSPGRVIYSAEGNCADDDCPR
jgi:hypothetical protein